VKHRRRMNNVNAGNRRTTKTLPVHGREAGSVYPGRWDINDIFVVRKSGGRCKRHGKAERLLWDAVSTASSNWSNVKPKEANGARKTVESTFMNKRRVKEAKGAREPWNRIRRLLDNPFTRAVNTPTRRCCTTRIERYLSNRSRRPETIKNRQNFSNVWTDR